MVTGATHGIGYEVSRRLAHQDTLVIVHGPTPREAHAAVDRLIRDGADPHLLEPVAADYARLNDVFSLAHRIQRRHEGLDLLINNVAVAVHPAAYQINYLSHYALTRLLAPALKAAGGRVVSVTSALHREGVLTDRGEGRAAYANAKLALTMFTRALRVTCDDRLHACAVHPGTIDTGSFASFYGRGGLRPGDGAAAVLGAGDGFYYEGFMRADAAPPVYDDASVRHLWRSSARLLGWDYRAGRAAA